MPSYNTNLKTWGSTGQEYPDNYSYVEGEQPVDAWDNFIMSNVVNDIEHLVNVTNNELLARDGSVALQADLSDDNANTIWDYSNGHVPVASQQADNITVTAGDGLKGGGSLSNQDGSTTLNVEPSDFAGSGLQDDGNDNLEVTQTYSDEDAQDAVGGILTNDFIYDDAENSIDLSFDPATQTELNNHANDASAHHSAPTVLASGSLTLSNYANHFIGSTYITSGEAYAAVIDASDAREIANVYDTGSVDFPNITVFVGASSGPNADYEVVQL